MDGKNEEIGQTDTQAHGFTDTQGRNNCPGLRLFRYLVEQKEEERKVGIRGQEDRRSANEHRKAAVRADMS